MKCRSGYEFATVLEIACKRLERSNVLLCSRAEHVNRGESFSDRKNRGVQKWSMVESHAAFLQKIILADYVGTPTRAERGLPLFASQTEGDIATFGKKSE